LCRAQRAKSFTAEQRHGEGRWILFRAASPDKYGFPQQTQAPNASVFALRSECRSLNGRFRPQKLLQPVSAECPYLGWADYAVCSEVLEHLDDPALFLRNSAALMSPGCTLIVTVPGGPMSAFDRHIGHRKHYLVSELRGLLERSGFSVKTAMAAGFPFSISTARPLF
jgi:hypothetical protein